MTMAAASGAHIAHILGFPRIGAQRELQCAVQAFCNDDARESTLQATAAALRLRHWQAQADGGMDFVCVGDFAWYDHVLSTLALLGALPARFGFDPQTLDLRGYFSMAHGDDVHAAMALRPWFDTAYHYLVPEWTPGLRFDGGVDWLFDELSQAQQQGHRAKVVLLGPLSLLYLGKLGAGLNHALDLLPQALAGYRRLLARLREQDVELVQIDEPILALPLPPQWRVAFGGVYAGLAEVAPELLLTTYFDAVDEHLELLCSLPVAAVHIDGVSAPAQLQVFAEHWPQDRVLSVGIVDGRNIWRCDLDAALAQLQALQVKLGKRLWLASSCSLLHVPVDLDNEHKLDRELKSWMAFAVQKLDEIALLKQALQGDTAGVGDTVASKFAAARSALAARRNSPRVRNALVQKRLQRLSAADASRCSALSARRGAQQARWQLPVAPRTSTEVWPHNAQFRHASAAYQRGEIGHLDYLQTLRDGIRATVASQESQGLDVLIYDPTAGKERARFFAEQLWGYGFTANGWVQRDGDSCDKPPFIYADIYRPEAISVGWARFAQSLTQKPLKGLLPGPLSLLQWAFVRDDQPRASTALQIALALRDEVADLEQAGIGMIQMDEPALQQGLLFVHRDQHYLERAIQAFKISTAGVKDETQIHLHLDALDGEDLRPWGALLDVDVTTIVQPGNATCTA